MRLHEERDVVGCEDVVQEVGVHLAELGVLSVLDTVPHRDQLAFDNGKVWLLFD